MIKNKPPQENIDIYVWEGKSDIFDRIARCLVSADVDVIRADGMEPLPEQVAQSTAIAIISVTVIDSSGFDAQDWQRTHGMPVIWVAEAPRAYDSRVYPPEYSHILMLDFTCAELRRQVFALAGELHLHGKSAQEHDPLIAESDVMKALLKEAETFADCDSNVLISGETGVGKERIARLLHDQHSHYGKGPFVAVNCGAIPDGLFESHFFGHAKGAFTGAMLAHKGYFEQADGGTLFLDEIGDLPLYQQVKLLRVLEQSKVTRLGSATEISVDFRLVAATNRNLRELVRQEMFRSDLYYRMAVIELRVPSLQERGETDKIAIFSHIVQRMLSHQPDNDKNGEASPITIPDWLIRMVANTRFVGNVRELRNIAERITIIHRQFGDWDRDAIDRVFVALREFRDELQEIENDGTRRKWDMADRQRIIEALDAHNWRRQDTANHLKMSRKVLWEKMRKFQIIDGETAAKGDIDP
ncbi:sigma-54-dependent Fis family transcriptional regulator [Oxalicibacterium solurbis]|uniref:Sigma-54-dependent Fis family transcriptional regulator n=1 Tax=Oxalicibacterium solurbis TaxID=69280 RepID=A0A8J3B2Z2_9BURK|nr:sigma-54 dependent transcriptional regulator [Oxalicibacterium solurbis]GGI53985.1 sigma-54-dependent Fis family transcriptional regulator [Oxalicibacterium solurbis]